MKPETVVVNSITRKQKKPTDPCIIDVCGIYKLETQRAVCLNIDGINEWFPYSHCIPNFGKGRLTLGQPCSVRITEWLQAQKGL